MHLVCSTTTDLVDRMEKNVLVARVRNKNDRWVVRIHLLKEGERIIEEVIKKRQYSLAQVFKTFSDEEIVF
jgi:DNA-binding MarR family transcriptional regulator